ncbi:hypothetical protein DBV05_g11250 [Lasiodiplodia theobromae]|uniref:Uncharacterized protein n=1 Tax=Lasiodiplodia theobromae TaxID=45133 RepID=A0A5N5CXK6_9PEZI|nr:hypothetical protein DBV05_g11250 [Lasiodiplodia theobromae]
MAEDGPDAASEMLKDHDNQRHIINSEFGGYEQGKTDVYGRPQSFQKYNFFKQLVSDAWDTFDQIYSQQDQAKKSQTQQLRIPGFSIEGYEYMDLVSLRSSLTRRYINLNRNGSEWSSFIRQINAITLFGQNFGEIYTPGHDEEHHICAPWRTVPMDHEYLTVPISLLKELNERSREDGKIGPESLEIAKHVLWTPSEGAFRRCAAAGREDCCCAREFNDRVQRLATTSNILKSLVSRKGAVSRKDVVFAPSGGAVIIGGSSMLIDAGACYSDNSSSAASFSDVRFRNDFNGDWEDGLAI